jgi:WD40 repeat protein/serine/threonine protein kinase
MSESISKYEPVEQLAEEFVGRYRRGERPSVSEYTEKHPELADLIREYFPAMVMMEEFGSVAGEGGGSNTATGREQIPEQLGEYRILREMGHGGMGIVFEAVQETLGRHVALKVLPFHGLLSRTHLERFRREARAAARLHHTNIVPVFGVGEHEGIHYYAMQFIQGQTLNEVLREVRRLRADEGILARPGPALEADVPSQLIEGLLSGQFPRGAGPGVAARADNVPPVHLSSLAPIAATEAGHSSSDSSPSGSRSQAELSNQPGGPYFRSVANLGVQVAEALEYAHREGILHRDIKPSNLLLDTSGRVWITDFGLAKAEDWDELTNPGDVVGTVRYMAPERFAGQADARSDVYGLGITLYELLTLRPAFDDSNRAQLIQRVAHEEPPRPRRLDRRIPRDLETIVLKATAKELAGRYPTAAALAEDLHRFLGDRPVCARRTPLLERVWRWSRRNQALACLIASAVLFITVIVIVLLLSASWLHDEAERARQAERTATRELWKSYFAQAQVGRRSGRPGQRFESLAALKKAAQIAHVLNLDSRRFLDLRNEATACLLLPDVHTARQWPAYPAGSTALVFDAKLERYAVGDSQGATRVYRTSDAHELLCLPGPGTAASDLKFSPDGRYLAVNYSTQQISVWHLAEARLLFKTPRCTSDACLAWGPGSSWVAVGLADRTVRLYEVPTGREASRLDYATLGDRLAVDASGRKVAVSDWGSSVVEVHDLVVGTALGRFEHPRIVRGLCWSPDGRFLACGCKDSQIYIWDLSDNKQNVVLRGHQSEVRAVTFNHTGDLLASQSWDGTLRLWNPKSGRQLLNCPGDSCTLQFSPDDALLGGMVRNTEFVLLDLAMGHECRSLDARGPGRIWMNALDISPDGRLLASASEDGVRLWDMTALSNVVLLAPNRYGSVLFQPDGSGLVAWGDSELRRWPIQIESTQGPAGSRSEPRWKISPPQTVLLRDKLSNAGKACWAPDGRGLLLTDRGNGQVVLLNLEKPQEKTCLREHVGIGDVAISPDGRWIATGGEKQFRPSGPVGHVVRVWDARTRQPIKDLLSEVACVAFSPDGNWLVTGSATEYCLWQVASWQPAFQIPRTDATLPGCVAFTQDSKLLAISSSNHTVEIFDLATRAPLATLSAPEPEILLWLRFNPAGDRLAAATENNLIQLWHLRHLREGLAAVDLDWDGPAYAPAAGKTELVPTGFQLVPATPMCRLEAEDLKIVDSADCSLGAQDMDRWDHSQWSHGRQLFAYAQAGGFLTLEVDVAQTGKYHLDIYFTKAPDYGILEVAVDGKPVGNRFDGFYGRVVPSGRIDFGHVQLSQGKHQIRFKVVDKNTASNNYHLGIDCLELKPANE